MLFASSLVEKVLYSWGWATAAGASSARQNVSQSQLGLLL